MKEKEELNLSNFEGTTIGWGILGFFFPLVGLYHFEFLNFYFWLL